MQEKPFKWYWGFLSFKALARESARHGDAVCLLPSSISTRWRLSKAHASGGSRLHCLLGTVSPGHWEACAKVTDSQEMVWWPPALFSLCFWQVDQPFHITVWWKIGLLSCHLGISLTQVQPNPELQAHKCFIHLSVSIQKVGNSKSLKLLRIHVIWFFFSPPSNCGEHGKEEWHLAPFTIYRTAVFVIASLSESQGRMVFKWRAH